MAERREVIRALVKRVEIDESEVRVVYKVRPCPFAEGPDGAFFKIACDAPLPDPGDGRGELSAEGRQATSAFPAGEPATPEELTPQSIDSKPRGE